jgi:hypothetical protein
MHGVPRDLDLAMFVGARLDQLRVGGWDLQFAFTPRAQDGASPFLQVEGRWELRSSNGELLDCGSPGAESNIARKPLELNQLLSREVCGAEVHAPESFTLFFDSGLTLHVFDSSDRYESFSIQPGDIFV